jgi:CBS domain-containing protein
MRVQEAMTTSVRGLPPTATVQEAARLMREINVGTVPVVDRGRAIGIVTDRDLAIRAIADGCDTHTPLRDAMTKPVVQMTQDRPLDEAVQVMREKRIGRLLITDETGALVGILSASDAFSYSISPRQVDALLANLAVRDRYRGRQLVKS